MRNKVIGLVLAAVLGMSAVAAAQDPIHWSVSISPKQTIAPGKTFAVELSAEVDPSWHLYALTQPPGGPVPLVITVPAGQPFHLAGEIGTELPKSAIDPNFNIETQFFEEHAAFTIPVGVDASIRNGAHRLKVTAAYQTCNDRLCLPPREEDLTLDVSVGGDPSDAANLATPPIAATPPPTGTVEGRRAARVPDMAAASAGANTLLGYLSLAAVMGALSLLTPCVFPMVPITVSYFTNTGRRTRRDAVAQALVYGLGIVLTFTAVGFTLAVGFGAAGLNRFAADPWLNLAVTALFVAFALSLFGVYDLALPSRLVTIAAKADAGRGRYAGTMLMGLAFTLTSFTCTAPFLGALFVVASQGDWQWPLAGMLAFSTVFALPFVVLALVPQLLSALPRSGAWLAGVKATMGLLELAAAMKFLSNADMVFAWGIFTRPVVIASWIAIAVILIVYLAGFLKLGHAPRLQRPGIPRLAAIAAGIVLAMWLASGLSGRRLGELEAFLPPADLAAASRAELGWFMNDYDAALAEAKRQDRPMLIDFTGYTCTNCRWMEANMFPKQEVTRELARYVRLRLYTDGRGEMFRRFQQMEQEWFGTVALPFYAVLTPAGQPVVSFGGLTRDSNEYVTFLRRGLE